MKTCFKKYGMKIRELKRPLGIAAANRQQIMSGRETAAGMAAMKILDRARELEEKRQQASDSFHIDDVPAQTEPLPLEDGTFLGDLP